MACLMSSACAISTTANREYHPMVLTLKELETSIAKARAKGLKDDSSVLIQSKELPDLFWAIQEVRVGEAQLERSFIIVPTYGG